MCDINFIWLLNILAAVVLIILQQQPHVVASKTEQHQHGQQQLQQHKHTSPYDRVSKYAAAAAVNYLHRTSLPHSVVKREIKNEKNKDYITYMSDFNIQDETSIPEDIIDQQHLQEIIDKQQQDIQHQPQQNLQQKYVGETEASKSVLKGDADIIDINLTYDDSMDTDSDADIILESQRSSEQSDNSNNKSSRSSSDSNKHDITDDEIESKKETEIDKNSKHFEKTNTKKETIKERTSNNKNDKKQQLQIKYEHNIKHLNQYSTYGDKEGIDFNDPYDIDDDDDDEGDEDKFELDEEDVDDGSAEYERFKTMHEQKQKQLQKQKENESKNEGTFTSQYLNEKMVDYTEDNNKIKNINDYEIFYKNLLQQRQKLLQQQQNQKANHKQDAIGDIEDNENLNVSEATNNNNKSNVYEKNKTFTNIFIPRKMKRHNGAARLDDATNRYSRLKQNKEEQQQKQQELKSQSNTEVDHPEAVPKVSSQEEIFRKKYYDILKENSTSGHHNQQQHHHHHISGESSFYDDNADRESEHEVKKQTAFEKEKSMRRNNKRYGHKTHKKKYKDYLRYSQIMLMTTTTSIPTLEHNHTKTAINMAKENHERRELNEDDVTELNVLKDKHVKKLKIEKIKSLIPAAPIFVLKDPGEKDKKEDSQKLDKMDDPTTKPFYEGQINYFLETPDDESERANEVRFITKGERMDTNDWYRKLSPVLRNGKKKIGSPAEERSGIAVGRSRGAYTPYQHHRPQQQGRLHHSQTRNHHYHQQHDHQQQHGRPAHQHHILKHSRHHAYQRKMIPKSTITTTTPIPPPSRKHWVSGNGIGEMGHQITDIKDLDRYYAKWPHLARVQSQLHEEQMREQQSENYPEYEYDNYDYIEENQNKDENLPPYIRKFNRRNKQLLDLLEGTIAPPTKTPQQLRWSGSRIQPGSRDSSVGSMSVHIDDDYLKEKRKRYHQRQRQIHDLFSQQRTSTTTHAPPPYPFVNANTDGDDVTARQYTYTENHLPDEDVSISLESNEQENDAKHDGVAEGDDANDDSKVEPEIWQQEIKTKSANMAAGNLQITNWQTDKLITHTPAASDEAKADVLTTTKSAIHKLPSYPSIAGGFMNRPRSRSAQFAPSSGSEYRRVSIPYLNDLTNNDNNKDNINKNNNNFINAGGFVAYNKAPVLSKTINGRFSANDYNKEQQEQSVLNTTTTSLQAGKTQGTNSSKNHLNPSPATSSSSVTNSFAYHRVVDASPRLVGAGFITGRKQRLPFVAITDRRLETSKKSLTDHQKDFEQNHYPLP